MKDDPRASLFARTARAYCTWAEGAPACPYEEMQTARRHLANLYVQAIDLPVLAVLDIQSPRVGDAAWGVVFKRFGALPVNYYSTGLDPLNLDDQETSIGDLADDLADVWRDIKGGLILHDAGHVEAAVWEWREHFTFHWAMHASSAMHVVEHWLQTRPVR